MTAEQLLGLITSTLGNETISARDRLDLTRRLLEVKTQDADRTLRSLGGGLRPYGEEREMTIGPNNDELRIPGPTPVAAQENRW